MILIFRTTAVEGWIVLVINVHWHEEASRATGEDVTERFAEYGEINLDRRMGYVKANFQAIFAAREQSLTFPLVRRATRTVRNDGGDRRSVRHVSFFVVQT